MPNQAFGRLRQVKNQSAQLVEENWYNGLGFRIVGHNDVDGDGDVDGSDQKFHLAYDTSWRIVGEFRGTDTTPKAYYLHHNAGMDGAGGSSYIDAVIYRERDANGNGGDWDDASDGTMEERLYYCQNWRADVVALITAAGQMAEQARYSPYGVPFGMPLGDVDSDGDCDSVDRTTLTYATPGDVRQDLDLDGDVDVNDYNILVGPGYGAAAGRGVLSTDKDDGVGNMLGYAGYVWSEYIARNHVRNRVYDPSVGRWTRRDPLGYVDGVNLYGYGRMSPIVGIDPLGTDCFGISCDASVPTESRPPELDADFGIGDGDYGHLGPIGGEWIPIGPLDDPRPGKPIDWKPSPGCVREPCPNEHKYWRDQRCRQLGWDGGLDVVFCQKCPNGLIEFFYWCKLKPPGDCGQPQYDRLKGALDRACAKKRKCTSGLNCDILKQRMTNARHCATARKTVMDFCFRGGDYRHQKEHKTAEDVHRKCQRIYNSKCGGAIAPGGGITQP